MSTRRLYSQTRPGSPFSLPLPGSNISSSSKRPGIQTFLPPIFLRRNHVSLFFGAALVALIIYSFRSRNLVAPPGLGVAQQEAFFEPADYEDIDGNFISPPAVPHSYIEIRESPHPNPHIPLPEETVFDHPWPENEEIANVWLNSERPSESSFSPPDWTAVRDAEGQSRKPNRLGKDKMVKWEDFSRPGGYEAAILTQANVTEEQAWPKIQKQGPSTETKSAVKIRRARREWVKKAFLHAWNGYKSQAWGHDQVYPISGQSSDFFNGWGATIVDSLSTMLLMNLTAEYSLARTHVRQIDFTTISGEKSAYSASLGDKTVPVFETIIRYLGGLISAYDLSDGKDTLMLERAEELAGWLMGAFDTRFGLPVGKYTFGSRLHGDLTGHSALAEVASFSLEFGRLAQITGKMEYYDIVHRAGEALQSKHWRGRLDDTSAALLPGFVDDRQGRVDGTFGFGAPMDSYYEYLLKGSLLFRNSTISSTYSFRYQAAIESAYSSGIIAPVAVIPGDENKGLSILGQIRWGRFEPVLEHLACFAGGMIAMGSRLLKGEDGQRDLETGKQFTKTCFWAYNSSYTGLGPETLTFYSPNDINRFALQENIETGEEYLQIQGSPAGTKRGESSYNGRPETIESVFYLWRITGDKEWQEKGWAMFTAWVDNAIAPFGFAGVKDVNSENPKQTDSMESFVLAETFKYYYLLFSDPDYLSLDEFVFSTEAHPLRLPLGPGGSPKSYSSPWSYSRLDEELQDQYADPRQADTAAVGMGTWVQQILCKGRD